MFPSPEGICIVSRSVQYGLVVIPQLVKENGFRIKDIHHIRTPRQYISDWQMDAGKMYFFSPTVSPSTWNVYRHQRCQKHLPTKLFYEIFQVESDVVKEMEFRWPEI